MKIDAAEVKSRARIEDEVWRDVVGYEGRYSVSNLGRIRRDAPGRGTFAGRILSGRVGAKGYPVVQLPGRLMEVHAIVARAFLGARPGALQVDHVNGDKADSRAANLEYVSRSENVLRAFRLGLKPSGEAHCFAKLTAENVRIIRSLCAAGESQRSVAKKFAVSHTTVRTIVNGTAWRTAA